MTQALTRGQAAAADVAALLRARNPLLWIVTREEARAERLLAEAAVSVRYACHTWDIAQGVCEMNGQVNEQIDAQGADKMLEVIRGRAESAASRDVWIMRDLPTWISGPAGARELRQLRNLARYLPNVPPKSAQAIIILTTSATVPDDLAGHATVIEWPLPDRAEIAATLDESIARLPEEMRAKAMPNGSRDAAIDGAIGLTQEEASSCYARSLVQFKCIDPVAVSREKKRIIARERVLEWIDPIPGGLDAVGGLANLKEWLLARKLAYSAKARAYGLPSPKGVLIAGIPGTGKSLTAKAVPTAFGIPCLRMDMGSFKSKFVGESEGTFRKALKVIEALGRCVVWIDEIEKALAGATQGGSDGGVSSDALGTLLSWMQERQGEAFVIATANDVDSLPPELLRKGRFDEIWWVDLPNADERVAILDAALVANKRSAMTPEDMEAVARQCVDFTGSEIAAIVPEAMFPAFADGEREITVDDLITVARTITPLAKTAPEKITRLRKWAEGKARRASGTLAAPISTTRQLDM